MRVNAQVVGAGAASEGCTSRRFSGAADALADLGDNSPALEYLKAETRPQALALEVGCGSARLTKQLLLQGVPALGVDWLTNRRRPTAPWLPWDLAEQWCPPLLCAALSLSWLLWWAVPCGTLSRIREKAISADLRARGVPEVPPLRSVDEPWGLRATVRDVRYGPRLKSANSLIKLCFETLRLCQSQEREWAVENPRNSILWFFREWLGLCFKDVDFAACMHGASRPKLQRLRCSPRLAKALEEMALECDNRHAHKAWGPKFVGGTFSGFATQEESEYPLQFARTAARLIAKLRASKSRELPRSSRGDWFALVAAAIPPAGPDEGKAKTAATKASVGIQARGRRLAPVVPEYKRQFWLKVDGHIVKSWGDTRPRLQADVESSQVRLLRGWRVLEARSSTGGVCGAPDDGSFVVKFGEYHSPSEFLRVAKQAQHPFELADISPLLADAVFATLTRGPQWLASSRRATLDKWRGWAQEVEREEDALLARLHPRVAKLAALKRPLLMRRILEDLKFPATEAVFSLLCEGVPMFGELKDTGLFPRRAHVASRTRAAVLAAAAWTRPAILGSVRSSGDPKCDAVIYEKTMAERDAGVCRGPLDVEALFAQFGSEWVVSRRFGVPQKDSFRPCDDYSEAGPNSTSSTGEMVDVEGVDAIAAAAKAWVVAVDSQGKVAVRDATGRRRFGWLHPELKEPGARALQARLVDLARAYKQLPAHPSDEAMAFYAVWNPHLRRAEIFAPVALGFGARNAVNGFNAFARAIQFILVAGLLVPVLHYFDDYSQIDIAASAKGGGEAMLEALELLGWDVKEAEDPARPFAPVFRPLGVEIDLSRAAEEGIVVANTSARKERVTLELQRLRQKGFATQPELDSLLGVLQFSDAQSFGRCGTAALRKLRRLGGGGWALLRSDEAREIIRFWLDYVASARPRLVPTAKRAPPILVFTDAAAEGDDFADVGIGAILVDSVSHQVRALAASVDKTAVDEWRVDGQRQIIGQAELAAIPIALFTWRRLLANRNVFVFIDNDSALDAAIKASSPHQASAALAFAVRRVAAAEGMGLWLERVPSSANPADWPSRGEFAPLRRWGALLDAALVPPELAGLTVVDLTEEIRAVRTVLEYL